MDKLRLKVRLSKLIDTYSIALAMIVLHDSLTDQDKKLAGKIIKAYELRKRLL